MEKRGISHIEVVLAFIIFTASVSFILYFFNPAETPRITSNSLDSTQNIIFNNLTTSVITIGLSINASSDGVKNANHVTIDLGDPIAESMNGRVENLDGESVEANLKEQRNIVCIKRTAGQGKKKLKDDFLIVKAGEDIQPYNSNGNYGCNPNDVPNDNDYQIGPKELRRLISANKTYMLNKTYYSNYEDLKKQLKIPAGVDFAFTLKYSDNYIISAQKAIPEGTDVLASTLRVEMITIDSNFTFADFTIKIW